MDTENGKKNRKMIIILLVISLIVIVAIVGVGFLTSGDNKQEFEQSEGEYDLSKFYSQYDSNEENQNNRDNQNNRAQVIFRNSDFVTEKFDGELGWEIIDVIRDKVMLLEDEIEAATEDNMISLFKGEFFESLDGAELTDDDYVATLDGRSLIEEDFFPYIVYSMQFELSDERSYQVSMVTYDHSYCGVIVQRVSPTMGQTYLYILLPEGANYSDSSRDETIKDIIEYSKTNYGGEIIVTTLDGE